MTDKLDTVDPNKREITYGNKKIIYEIHMRDNKYKGITIDVIDPNEEILDAEFLSINPSLYTHNIVSNFDPNADSHILGSKEDWYGVPEESWVVDNSIFYLRAKHNFIGNYLGNIIFNTPDGKKIACFISKKDSNRYYKFLDLTGTDILACSEWDMDYEYLGIEYHKEEHDEFIRRLNEMISTLDFTTLIEGNGKEKLIDFNGDGITEEGIKKFEIFKNNILELLNRGIELFQPQDKPELTNNDSNDEMDR